LADERVTASAGFPTTRWSAVGRIRSDDAGDRARAMGALVAAYWRPSYKHVRIRWKRSREDAEDAVQSFFERATEKDFFAAFDPERGRFRTFLRVCLDRHVSNDAKAQARLKRGGGVAALALDFDAAEDEIARAGAAAWESPEECFDREWRRSIFAGAIEALRVECNDAGKSVQFTIFERYDLCTNDRRPTYEELASEVGVPATTVTNHLAYARRELRRLVLAKLGEITDGDHELQGEATALLGGRLR
jgi:RNA polymerase sigma factor (sigma-70 family)